MVAKQTSNWFKSNKEVVGWVIAALIYGAGLYAALRSEVSANTTSDAVQEEKIQQNTQRVNALEVTVKEMNDAIQRIDKNVVEIKTDLKYKKDK